MNSFTLPDIGEMAGTPRGPFEAGPGPVQRVLGFKLLSMISAKLSETVGALRSSDRLAQRARATGCRDLSSKLIAEPGKQN